MTDILEKVIQTGDEAGRSDRAGLAKLLRDAADEITSLRARHPRHKGHGGATMTDEKIDLLAKHTGRWIVRLAIIAAIFVGAVMITAVVGLSFPRLRGTTIRDMLDGMMACNVLELLMGALVGLGLNVFFVLDAGVRKRSEKKKMQSPSL